MKMLNSFLIFFSLVACDSNDDSVSARNEFADVTELEVNGQAGAYRFAVTISSPDTGCDQYADWWEVLSEDGKLLHRRILAHSHVDEQPFTRIGAGIDITENQAVYVRAHMNNTGYGGQVMKGTVEKGFEVTEVDEDFAIEVEDQKPLPDDCAF